MMPKKLVIINGLLILIAAGSAAFIARQFMAPMAVPLPARGRPAAAPAARDEAPPTQVGAYTSVAARNHAGGLSVQRCRGQHPQQ